jgi:hypothetical protein
MSGSKMQRLATMAGVLVLALAACFSLSACGSSDDTSSSASPSSAGSASPSSGAGRTYVDPTYGFSITVPKPFERDTTMTPPPVGEFKTAAVWSYTGGSTASGEPTNDFFLVAVMPSGKPVSPRDAQMWVNAAAKDAITAATKSGRVSNDMIVKPLTVDGRPAAQLDLQATAANGRPSRIRFVWTASESELYLFWATSWQSDWKRLEPAMSAAVKSFTFGT